MGSTSISCCGQRHKDAYYIPTGFPLISALRFVAVNILFNNIFSKETICVPLYCSRKSDFFTRFFFADLNIIKQIRSLIILSEINNMQKSQQVKCIHKRDVSKSMFSINQVNEEATVNNTYYYRII